MFDDMLSTKALVDWLPVGRFYCDGFSSSADAKDYQYFEVSVKQNEKSTSSPEKWKTRTVNGVSEELHVGDRTVIWSSFSESSIQFPKLVINTESDVVTACWASFFLPSVHSAQGFVTNVDSATAGRLQSGLAVFEKERLTYIDQDGEQYIARLPCRLASAWPLETVILLERQLTDTESSSSPTSQQHEATDLHARPSNNTLFTLFSLSHPLDEAAPVLLKVPLPSGRFGICFVSDVDLKIVTVIASLNLVLTCHRKTGLHSLWIVEKADPEDYVHLYEIGEDGRAYVPPRSLGPYIRQPHTPAPADGPAKLFRTPHSSLSIGYARSEQKLNSTACTHNASVIRTPAGGGGGTPHGLSLSPFAASLSRLTGERRVINRGIRIDSPMVPPGSPVLACPLTPSSLSAHISRLGSLSTVQRTCPGVSGAPVPASRRGSLIGLSSGSKLTANQSSHASSLLRPAYTANRSGGTSIHDTLVNATRPSVADVEDLLDEPLLPYCCLRLVWTEPPRCLPKPKRRARWNSNTTDAPNPQHTGLIDVISDSPSARTPIYEPVDSPASRVRLLNRRILDLSIHRTPAHPNAKPHSPVTGNPPLWLGDSLYNNEQDFVEPNPLPTGSASKLYTSNNEATSTAFLALDFVAIPWMCFLTPASHGLPSSLACVPVRSFLSASCSLKNPKIGTLLASNHTPVYLLAVDAVHVPSSRITACLEPGTGVVLYSGVKKVCILGVSPPPVLGIDPICTGLDTIGLTVNKKLPRFRSPFVIRPSNRLPDPSHANVIRDLLDSLKSSSPALLQLNGTESLENNPITTDEENGAEQDEVGLTIKNKPHDLLPKLLEPESIQTEFDKVPVDRFRMLHDASGNSFTMFEGGSEKSKRFLRVYLPEMTENELVQRCLAALQRSLPHEVSLHLLSRWYSTINAPGTGSSLVEHDVLLISDGALSGPPEWVRFALFMLQSCGLMLPAASQSPDATTVSKGFDVGRQGRDVVPLAKDMKRQRPTNDTSSTSNWDQLRACLGDMGTDPSLLAPQPARGKRSVQPVVLSLRTDPSSRLLLTHLPTVLFSFHLVYEEAKLSSILYTQLVHLAELNILLSQILHLSAYRNYYVIDWPELAAFHTESTTRPNHADLHWPAAMPKQFAPCLLTWLIAELESRTADPSQPIQGPYVHLAGVNDLAVTLVGMMLSALRIPPSPSQQQRLPRHQTPCWTDARGAGEETETAYLNMWQTFVTRLDGSCEDTALWSKDKVSTPRATDAPVSMTTMASDPFASAFVRTMQTAEQLGRFEANTASCSATSMDNRLTSPHNLAVIYLSQVGLGSAVTESQSILPGKLRSLPSGFATVLQLWLSRARSDPPPNCAHGGVYNLMGREDLARQAGLTMHQSSVSTSSSQTSKVDSQSQTIDQAARLPGGSSWTLAECWANRVKPLREPRLSTVGSSSTTDGGGTENVSNMSSSNHVGFGRHALLRQLESNPSCQVAFKDDLRLREAYRLLQSSSHIRLPRLSTANDSTGGGHSPTTGDAANPESGTTAGRQSEPRLEMHLAAAGIRVWASAVGRGMLGLSCLLGSRVPTRLRVPPICLRGRSVSSSSGQRVLFDLARESLAGATAATATGAGAGATGTPAGRQGGAAGLEGVGNLIGDITGDRRIPMVNGVSGAAGDLGSRSLMLSAEAIDASNHPGNSMALAIASAVSASGAGAALRTASLDLTRMVPLNSRGSNYFYGNQSLSAIATMSATSTASLLSTTNLQQTPAVLAAKYWPDFHNGVAVGLSISPHASIDATWIMYNCRSYQTTSTARPGTSSSGSTIAAPTAEHAGLLYGLGLNGHLNRMSARDIGEYLVQIHDLHNMAVLLGLCAGKRGSMDQSVLRLLAVHYRPLLPSDPLVHVQLSVPSLCQAAAVFGLGLLYEGSAHRHITTLLLNELGRSLNGASGAVGSNSGGGSVGGGGGSMPETDLSGASRMGSSATSGGGTSSSGGSQNVSSGAAGSGGLAGDSCELIALSAGLALGLVLLRRGDTPCGLSDLPWAEQLHAYMTGAPRVSRNHSVAESSRRVAHQTPFAASTDQPLWSARLHSRLISAHQPGRSLGVVSSAGVGASAGNHFPSSNEVIPETGLRSGMLRLPGNNNHTAVTAAVGNPTVGSHDLLLLVDESGLLDEDLIPPSPDHMDAVRSGADQSSASTLYTPVELRAPRGAPHTRQNHAGTTVASATDRPGFTGRTRDRIRSHLARPHVSRFPTKSANPQIRELDCYNVDVSAPGAIMALGMAYMGTGSSTVSSWLIPPISPAQLELVRPDLLLFRALAHGLIHWHEIEPTQEWLIDAFCPAGLLDRLRRISPTTADESEASNCLVELAQLASGTARLVDLSSEDDVENRCPDGAPLPATATPTGAAAVARVMPSLTRHRPAGTARPTTIPINATTPVGPGGNRGGPRQASNGAATRPRNVNANFSSRGLSAAGTMDPGERGKLARGLEHWGSQFSADATDPLDVEAVSLAYLNILMGRAFALSLRFAGTCHPGAANLLFDTVQSLLNGSWWPPTSATVSESTIPTRPTLPKATVELAVAHCLLSLAIVLAGSGNLTVLRLARQLRAIRLFRTNRNSTTSSTTGSTLLLTASGQPRRGGDQNARPNAVATAASRAAAACAANAANQTSGGGGASSHTGPVSVAAVFGAALGPQFGIQMIYGSIIGLLFLGGGRLTLSNTPQAVAILTIAFLPILPGYPGDNWYHLQALRHLYVLATCPRRLCAVDVDTGRVVLSDMRGKLRDQQGFISSKDTFVLPSGVIDELDWLEINSGSETYWPTVFYKGTKNWEQLKIALAQVGYILVKRKTKESPDTENGLLSRWSITNVSARAIDAITDLQLLRQLKLVVAFLRRFPQQIRARPDFPISGTGSAQSLPDFELGKTLANHITQGFMRRKSELSPRVRQYYLNPTHSSALDVTDRLLAAFTLWFSLPPRDHLSPILQKLGPQKPSLAIFVASVGSTGIPIASLPWLYSLLYPKEIK